MARCKKCGLEFEVSKGLIQYCSLRCRNSRVFSDETNKLKSAKTKQYYEALSESEKEQVKLRLNELRKKKQSDLEYLFNNSFESLAWDSKRTRVIVEQAFKCNKCGLDSWLGSSLTIEIDHKDGNNTNDSRDNLEGLCPNCHSQTDTWRGRKVNTGSAKAERIERLKQQI